MSSDFKPLAATDDYAPSSGRQTGAGVPCLLAAFPKLVALRVPRTGEIVGRSWLDDAGISDSEVSREHISFSRADGRLHIKDHRSHNGTFVDGVRLDPDVAVYLDDGSVIRLGQTILVYREAFSDPLEPQKAIGKVVGPWGLGKVRQTLFARAYREGLNVLIAGDKGTGKKLLAEEIALQLGHASKIVSVNFATIPREAVEGNVFGWEKNAGPGNFQVYGGLLRSAAGATVYLDEIEALPLDLEPKLLRFLDKRLTQPVGIREILPPVDCLVIAATTHGIQEFLAKDTFRRDWMARFPLRFSLPSLAERPEDLFSLFAARWEQIHGKIDSVMNHLHVEAIDRLMRYDWPENTSELFRFVDSLDPRRGLKKSIVDRALGLELNMTFTRRNEPLMRDTVDRALNEAHGNRSRAASLLGVARPQLMRWLRKNGKGFF